VLYKLLPGSGGEESIAYNSPAPFVQPAVPQLVTAAQPVVKGRVHGHVEVGGDGARLLVTALPAPGKRPLHLGATRAASPEDSVGLLIREPASGARLAYFSGAAGPSDDIARAADGAGALFFDGTFWSSDELIAAGLGTRRAEDMAHWPVGGDLGSLSFLARVPGRRVYIHINNTNPMLREDSGHFLRGLWGTMHFGVGRLYRSFAQATWMLRASDRNDAVGRATKRRMEGHPNDGMQFYLLTDTHLPHRIQ
jgi:hypothetical protein